MVPEFLLHLKKSFPSPGLGMWPAPCWRFLCLCYCTSDTNLEYLKTSASCVPLMAPVSWTNSLNSIGCPAVGISWLLWALFSVVTQAAHYFMPTTGNIAHVSTATVNSLNQMGFNVEEGKFHWYLISTTGNICLPGGDCSSSQVEVFSRIQARYAGGCTSGHAISGLSALQLPSLIAVIGFFMGGLVMTAYFPSHFPLDTLNKATMKMSLYFIECCSDSLYTRAKQFPGFVFMKCSIFRISICLESSVLL